MADQINIWRTARLMIELHNVDAEIRAAQRADELLDAGDVDGARVWKMVSRHIKELRGFPPGHSEKIH